MMGANTCGKQILMRTILMGAAMYIGLSVITTAEELHPHYSTLINRISFWHNFIFGCKRKWGSNFSGGQINVKSGSLIQFAAYRNYSLVVFYDFLHNGK